MYRTYTVIIFQHLISETDLVITKSESNWKTYYNYYKLPYEEFNK